MSGTETVESGIGGVGGVDKSRCGKGQVKKGQEGQRELEAGNRDRQG